MILMNLKIDNFMAFNEFDMNLSYAKKIVGNTMTENLKDHPNFRYRKLNIIMGANASGKTSIGKILLSIFKFINEKEFITITSNINNHDKQALIEVEFVEKDTFYRVSTKVLPISPNDKYSSKEIYVRTQKTQILKNDTYEKVLKKLSNEDDVTFSNDYTRELEKVENLSWVFEFPRDSERNAFSYTPHNEERYITILKNTLQALDPLITEVKKTEEPNFDNAYVIKLGDFSIMIGDGKVILGADKLSSGTKEGISLANMYAAMNCEEYSFFYCDEKFSYIHSDIEKAFLSIMVDKLEGDRQLFFTTHDLEILDMDFPKHSFNFLRKEVYDNKCYISFINASKYIKKNSDSLKIAVLNDLLSSAPMVDKILDLSNI